MLSTGEIRVVIDPDGCSVSLSTKQASGEIGELITFDASAEEVGHYILYG